MLATVTSSVSVVDAPDASVPENVHERFCVPVHDQFAPLAWVSVMPVGRLSPTMIGAVVTPGPLFVTVIAYCAGCPTMNVVGVAVFASDSDAGASVVVAVLELFAVFGSVAVPAGVTVAVFAIVVPLVGAVPVIVNVTLAFAGRVAIVLVTALPATLTPPQVAPPLVVAHVALTLVMPAGTVSANCAPSPALGPAFETTTEYEIDAPSPTDVGPVLTTERSADALTSSVPLPPVPALPFALVIDPVVLTIAPGSVATTLTTIAHDDAPAIVPPLSDVDVAPATAVAVPPQVFETSPVPLARPAGYASTNATPVSGCVFGFVIWIVIVDAPPTLTVDGENDFVVVGAVSAATVSVPLAAAPATAFALVIVLVVLTCAPMTVPTTLTTIKQLPLAGIVPPVNASEPAPAVASATPPQVLLAIGVASLTMPAGYVSVNEALVIATAFGLVSAIVICDALPIGTVAGENDFVAVGALSVVTTSVPLAPGLSTALPSTTVPVTLV